MEEPNTKMTKKVLMFPWLAFGHISPFLELAKKLSQNNSFQIYLCSSQVNLQTIHSKLPQNSSNPIQLIELKIPSLPELPPNMHSTNGLPLHLIPILIKAFEMGAPDFDSILHKINPNLLITDTFQPWAIQSASSLNIPVISFTVVSAAILAHTIHYVLNRNTKFPYPELDLMGHWIHKRNPNIFEDPDVAMTRFLQWVEKMELCSDVFLVNSFEEIEGKYLDYLSVLLKKKVVPVGPLIQEAATISTVDERSDIYLEWLDKKEPKSTVYVSFGSEYYLSKEDRAELAYGLEMSGGNFIWVIRFPKGEKLGIEEVLPNGFMERIGDRGIVVDGWAPQLKILKHLSIGGFVCHCGWNSVVEAAAIGVPIVALPMQLDQPTHGKVAVAAGVGVEAERGVDGAVEREGVAKAIKQVLFEKTGENLNLKVKEICGTLKGKEGQNIERCVMELTKICDSMRPTF